MKVKEAESIGSSNRVGFLAPKMIDGVRRQESNREGVICQVKKTRSASQQDHYCSKTRGCGETVWSRSQSRLPQAKSADEEDGGMSQIRSIMMEVACRLLSRVADISATGITRVI